MFLFSATKLAKTLYHRSFITQNLILNRIKNRDYSFRIISVLEILVMYTFCYNYKADSSDPALNLTDFFAGILITAFVLGLIPFLAAL